MAKTKIGGITVEIGADTSDLSKKLKDVNTESKKTTSELKSIDAALKQAPNSVELWKQKQEALAKSVENSKKKLEALVSEQENLKKGLEQGTVTEEAYKAYQREIEITKGQIESAEKALSDFTNAEDKAGTAAKQTGSDLEKSGKQAEDSSEGYTVLKNVIANLAADGFEKLAKSAKDAWEEIDAGYDTIATKTGATGDALEALQKSADNVYKTLPVEMSDTSEAIGEINTRLGAQGEELESLTTDFLKYSNINGTQVANSVRNVSGIMKAYQEDVSNTGKVLDVLSDVSQRTGKDINSLESELLSNADTFKEMGFDIRQSAELLGQFESNGIEASTALAGLKKAQQNATAEGKTMTEALGETLENIKDAKTETEALQIAQELFGKKGAASMAHAVREQRFSIDDLTAGYSDMRDVVNETFEATQDAPDKAKIALNNLKLELASLAEKVLPKVEKLVDKGVQNLPKIEKTVKEIIPLIKTVGIAYASWKIASTATDGVKALKTLTTQMQSTEKAAKSLNTVLESGATIIISGIIAGLVELGGEIKKAHDNYVPTAERISKQVSAAFEEQQKAIDGVNESLKEADTSFKDTADAADIEANKAYDLWTELQRLADESGRVKDADKKRAEYIKGELEDALGIEINMTGNQIQNYKDLQAEIDKVIEKKRAAAYLDAYQASAGEMAKNKATVKAEYMSAYSKEQAAIEEYNKLSQDRYGRILSTEEFQALMNKTYAKNDVWNTIDTRMLDLAKTAETAGTNRKQLQQQYDEINQYFNRLEEAQIEYTEGNYEQVEKRLYYQKDADREALKSAKKWTDETEKIYESNLKKLQAAVKLARDTNAKLTQSDFDELIDVFTDTAEAAMKVGGKTTGEIFSNEFMDEVQDAINEGYKIDKLAKWARESGIDIGDVFGDDYTEVIQSQIDKGYDVRQLLLWAAASGANTGKDFTDKFTEKYQGQLDLGFDISALLSWAAAKGYEVGDVFGENWSRRYSEWIESRYWENPNSINEHSINSQADYEYWKSQGYDFHAAGGFIPYGSKGIVAEAGPELLEVMNGGVRVTNLTPSATNTTVGAGKTTNNYYYNTVNAAIGSRYDVYKLAEDLDTAEHRQNMGKGR